MSLKGIMSVSGQGGLFKVVTQTKSGFVVESLADKKRTVISTTQQISMLDDISMFMTDGDKPLKEVLLTIKEKNGNDVPVNPKSEPAELKKYFKSVFPTMDDQRVYVSDMKKIISWYGLLKDIITKEEEPKEAPEPEEQKTAESKAEQPDT
ncbi:MAG: DUF5606 domain-containing protein [Bacteroidia bacterium]